VAGIALRATKHTGAIALLETEKHVFVEPDALADDCSADGISE